LSVELFIYWHCRRADREAALQAARAFQAELAAGTPGLAPALFVRDDDTTAGVERVTVMETYAAAPAGIDAGLHERIRDEGHRRLAAWLQGLRHIETFRRA
jgi:hypothetical protein